MTQFAVKELYEITQQNTLRNRIKHLKLPLVTTTEVTKCSTAHKDRTFGRGNFEESLQQYLKTTG